MRLVNVGYGNVVVAERVVAVVGPAAAPVRRLRENAREGNKLIDATEGRKTRSVIVLDSDQDHRDGNPETFNNWPEAHNNHGKDGVQMGFLDGHAGFIKRGPKLIETYLWSNTTAATDVRTNITQGRRLHPGVVQRTVRVENSNAVQWVIDRPNP